MLLGAWVGAGLVACVAVFLLILVPGAGIALVALTAALLVAAVVAALQLVAAIAADHEQAVLATAH